MKTCRSRGVMIKTETLHKTPGASWSPGALYPLDSGKEPAYRCCWISWHPFYPAEIQPIKSAAKKLNTGCRRYLLQSAHPAWKINQQYKRLLKILLTITINRFRKMKGTRSFTRENGCWKPEVRTLHRASRL